MPLVNDECDWTAGIPSDWMAWYQHKDVVSRMGKQVVDQSFIDWLSAEGKAHTESVFLYDLPQLSWETFCGTIC